MNRLDAIDRLNARLCMLEAQALTLAGGGEEPFLRLAGIIRANYFWGMLAGIEESIELLTRELALGEKTPEDLRRQDDLNGRLGAMRAQCALLQGDAAEGDLGHLTASMFADLMMGMADSLGACLKLARALNADPQPAVAEAA